MRDPTHRMGTRERKESHPAGPINMASCVVFLIIIIIIIIIIIVVINMIMLYMYASIYIYITHKHEAILQPNKSHQGHPAGPAVGGTYAALPQGHHGEVYVV